MKPASSCTGFSYFPLLVLVLFIVSCSGKEGRREIFTNQSNTSLISYAKRITLVKINGYSQVSVVNPWQGAEGIKHEWYLVPRDSALPDNIDTSGIIRVPVRSIVCMSTTHLAMISALGEIESVAGFSGTGFLFDTSLIENVRKGKLKEVGYEENLNKEMIINISPDVVITYGVGGESSGYVGKIRELGFKVLFNADYLETDPLGKAEWIKLFGALYCKEEIADSIFRSVEKEYLTLKNYIKSHTVKKPLVMLGLPFRDTWYISPGNSYISAMISDAGGRYLWEETHSPISMPTSLEKVYIKSLDADYWLNIGTARSKDEITAVDARLSDMKCFRQGNLFNNNNRTNSTGGNDYWESGCINPHVLLLDLASIFHPEYFGTHKLFYYKKVK